MKLIFLDFDGVINSTKWMHSDQFKQETKDLSDADLYLIKVQYLIDPNSIQLINELVDRSKAEVVVSSTWRHKFSIDELNSILKSRGSTFNIIDKTPRRYSNRFSQTIARGIEIQAYLDSLPHSPDSIVILDDIDNMLHLSKYLILTYDETGITTQNIESALKMLNKKYTKD
jgi:hypothetical protein